MALLRFLFTRLLSVLVVMLAVTAITFLMMHILRPESFGDPRPLATKLFEYLERGFLHLDFGQSWDRQGSEVTDVVLAGLPADVSLMAGGLVLGTVAGTIAGAYCAARPGTLSTRVLEAAGAFFLIAPVYWVGLMLILTFGAGFGAIPIPFFETNVYEHPQDDLVDWFRALFVPWIVVGLPLAALCLRMMRTSMTDVLDEDYLRTATAKGLHETTVLRRHAGPAAASPVLTLVGVNMATMLTNVVLVEHAFSVPGVFRLTRDAMNDGNFPLLMGMTVAGAAMVVVANLVVDVVHAFIDPRVRVT